jgi:organic radical activating enzyme
MISHGISLFPKQTMQEISNPIRTRQVLPVMEQFYTIQGEGKHTGSAAYFIRLAGCDVGCVWCDVKESWHTEGYPQFSTKELVDNAVKSGSSIVVITGGEPAMHNLTELTEALQRKGMRTHIETSGAHPISGSWHWICLSPKKFKKPLREALAMAHELKVVVYNKHDFKWAEEHAMNVRENCELFLQPEWSRSEDMLPLIIDYVKAHPKWKISLQTHKFMQIP